MTVAKAAPAAPASTTATAAAVPKAAPNSNVGSATSNVATSTVAAKARPPTTASSAEDWVPPGRHAPSVVPTGDGDTSATSTESVPVTTAGVGSATPAATATVAAAAAAAVATEAAAVDAVALYQIASSLSESAESASTVASAPVTDDNGRPTLEAIAAIGPPSSSTVAGSAATIVNNPLFWQVGEGAANEIWWKDCSQEFAAVLHQQRNQGIRRARYHFYGNLAIGGAVPFVHDFDERVQTNERTGQRKRLRLLQAVALD